MPYTSYKYKHDIKFNYKLYVEDVSFDKIKQQFFDEFMIIPDEL